MTILAPRFIALALLVAALYSPVQATEASPVAQASLVVGQAYVIRASDEHQQPFVRGQALYEGDRLVTGDDGMVMLVFIDQGRVALRPGSELRIRSYRYDQDGQDTDLQLELLRGTVRQISGQAAHRQPERYRLNTPIAAIGVRGTDFLARVDPDAVRTYVSEGAITVQTHGSSQALLSHAGEGRSVLAHGEGHLEQQTLRLAELQQTFRIEINPGNTNTAVASTSTSASSTTATSGTTIAAAVLSAQPSGADPWPTHIASSTDSLTPGSAPSAVVPVEVPAALVWGHIYSNPAAIPLTLLQTADNAAPGRHPTVGEPGAYALWRSGPAGQEMTPGLSGQASFALTHSEAYYQHNSGTTQVAQLSNGRLNVNFDNAQFQTQLQLSAPGQLSRQLQVDGRINSEGIFVGRSDGQRVAGALTLDARQAGYLFEAAAGGGSYHGITLWGRK